MQSAELRKISASGNQNGDFNGETNNNVPVGVGASTTRKTNGYYK